MNNNGVRLQNVRDFTVQIRHSKTNEIVGTGFVVSSEGKIVTCKHVAEDAGVNIWQETSGWKKILPEVDLVDEVSVYFPQTQRSEEKKRRARVTAYFSDYEDDVVLLQLIGDSPPIDFDQIAVLGRAEHSFYHPFRSYGYRNLGTDVSGGIAYGTIAEAVERPEDTKLQTEPIQLDSNHISGGMSGSAVLDIERNLVVGVIYKTWVTNHTHKDQNTAWAVNARVLSFDSLNLPLRDEPLPKRPARQPSETEQAAAQQTTQLSFPLEPEFRNAPPSLGEEWAGRTNLLQAITGDWADPERRVTGLVGFGGEGKSSLARRWLGDVLNQRLADCGPCPQPDGVFWWGFYESRSVDAFFEAALTYLGGAELAARVTSATARAGVITALLRERRFIFVLDGLEVMQHEEGDSYGLLKSNDLRDFLNYFAGTEHQSFGLITSRAPLLDLLDYPTYTHHDVDRLDNADARALLRNLGVSGSDQALDELTRTWDGHALTLSLLGSDIVERYGGDSTATDLPAPDLIEDRYDRVARVLRRYDDHLTEAEKAFLTIFSAFRLPVHESALETVFQVKSKKSGFMSGLFGKKSAPPDPASLLAPSPRPSTLSSPA